MVSAAALKSSALEIADRPLSNNELPADWEWMPLSAVCRQICDGTHFTPRYVSNGIPFYSVENVTARDFENTKFISQQEHIQLIKRCKPEHGDILMTRITAGVIGDTYLIDLDVNASIYVSLALLKPNSKINAGYLYRYSQSNGFIQSVERHVLTNATPKKINMADIGKIRIPVPVSVDEQESIAGALSDAASSIESLEVLLDKKRAIRQGTMQDLLTGRTRLPGFAGAWRENRFGALFDFLPTATNSRSQLSDEGDAAYLHYGDIHTRFHNHLDFGFTQLPRIDRGRCRNAALLINGDWIMADASEDYEGVAKSVEIVGLKTGDAAVSGLHTFLLREKQPTFALGFKGYLANCETLRRQYLRVATGMKVFGVSKTALRDLVLPIPEWKEQEAIRDVLNDMSAELEGLEGRLTKARRIKQGMMQDLLTGRVRLV